MSRKIFTAGIVIFIVMASTMFFAGCTEEPEPGPGDEKPVIVADDSEATPEGIGQVVNGSNQFAFDFFLELSEEEDNIFFSPYSISVALAMTYEGARGETAEEMQSVMHFPENDSARRSAFAALHNQINDNSNDYTLSTANALWAHENYMFLEEYFNTIEQYYAGKATNLDFTGEAEKSREAINNWVEEQTYEKIKDLIPEGYINAMTRLVLTNAIYFKGNWLTQFDKDDTRDSDFHVDSETAVTIPMMSIKQEKFDYYSTGGLQILELPYKGEDLSMLILLPGEGLMDSLESSLTLENLAEWRSSLRENEMDIYIPKFKFETKYFMNNNLKEMGMPTAFSGTADLSGMDGKNNLFISSVIHQGFIDVNEKGTEAAAATAVSMATSVPPSFNANHPFIFLIQDNVTGNILFMGRVTDPSQ
jgi:serpin B